MSSDSSDEVRAPPLSPPEQFAAAVRVARSRGALHARSPQRPTASGTLSHASHAPGSLLQDLDDIIAQVETKNRKVAEEAAAKEAAADIGKALASMQEAGGEKTYQIKVQSHSCPLHICAAVLRTLFLPPSAASDQTHAAPLAPRIAEQDAEGQEGRRPWRQGQAQDQ